MKVSLMKKAYVFWIFIIVFLVLNILTYYYNLGGESLFPFFSNLFPIISSFLAALSLFAAFNSFKSFDKAKLAWLLLYLGILLFFVAESVFAIGEIVFNIDMDKAFPTAADYIWVLGYLPLIIGIALMIYWYNKSGFLIGGLKVYGFLSLPFLVLSAVLFFMVFMPIIKDTETSMWAKFVYIFYPVADLALIVEAGVLMYITSLFSRGSVSRPWRYISGGFILMTVADILYSYWNWSGAYASGNFIDIGWNLSYLLLALGGIYQQELMESF